MVRKFFKDSIIYTIPAFVSRGISVILAPLYMQVLSPTDYGSLDLLLVFEVIVHLTIALEVSQGVARYFSTETDPIRKVEYASSAFWFTIITYSVFAIIMYLSAPLLADLIMGQSGLELAFRIGVINICASGLLYAIQNQLRWELRSLHYAAISLFSSISTTIFSFYFALFLEWKLIGLLLGMTVGSILSNVIGLWFVRGSIKFIFSTKRLQEMLMFSVPLVFSGIVVWINSYSDRLMINHFLSTHEVGLYGIGYRLSSTVSLVIAGFQLALTPIVYTNSQNPDTPIQVNRIFRWFAMLVLLCWLTLATFSREILKLIAPSIYIDSSSVVPYLVVAIFLSEMYVFAPGVFLAKKTHLVFLINLGTSLLNVILNYLLIPLFAIEGASIATMLSSLFLFSSYVVIGQGFYRIPYEWPAIFLTTSFTLLITLLLSYLEINIFISYILTIASLATLSIETGLIKRSEIAAASRFLNR